MISSSWDQSDPLRYHHRIGEAGHPKMDQADRPLAGAITPPVAHCRESAAR